MPISTGPKYEFIGSEALQRQIELLKYYPEIFDRHFYPAMQQAAELVKSGVRANIPVRSGRVQRALGSKLVHSKSLGTRAHIGFGKRYGQPSAPYAAALNEGAVAHEITARRTADGYLHFSSGGRFTAVGSVRHPGFSGRGFMEAGLEAATPGVDNLMDAASGRVVQELAQP